jgi:type I restriction enzyme, S subunit
LEKNNKPPNGWVETTIGKLYEIVGGGTPSTKNSSYWNGKFPWVTSADIYGIKDIRSQRKVTKKGIENSSTHLVPAGSILVVTRVGLGKLAITDIPICTNQDVQTLVGNDNVVFPPYALHYLSSAVLIFKYNNRGTTISGVTKKQLSDLNFFLPPFTEQKRIVEKIEEMLSKINSGEKQLREILGIVSARITKGKSQNIEDDINRFKILKLSLLKQAFEGKLVPQDPNDEPASELLKRIKLK